MMVTSLEIEKRRSPSDLRKFVLQLKEVVQADDHERHLGILKKGLYKEFLDELVPLSCFAKLEYPDSYSVQLILGNQGYDAKVFNEMGEEVDRIEITVPHDGAAEATDARVVAKRGYGQCKVGKPGEDFYGLFPEVLSTC